MWLCASVENDLYNWKEIVLNAIGTWNQERIYNKEDIVTYNGALYVSKLEQNLNNPISDETKWRRIDTPLLKGTEAPTIDTEADFIGQIFIDTANGKLYFCNKIENGSYTWVMLQTGSGVGFAPQFLILASPNTQITANNGTTNLVTMSDSEGKATIDIPNYGVWVVSEGDYEISVNVTEVKQYQIDIKSVINYTMLYDDGNECEDITGGWVSGRYITAYNESAIGIMTKREYDMYCKTDGLTSGGFFTSNLMDLSDYSRVYYNLNVFDPKYTISIAINPTERYGRDQDGAIAVKMKNDTHDELAAGINFLNISNITQSCYIGFGCWAYGTEVASNEIFLTKADDYATLCEKAGVTAPGTLDELIADSSKLTTIFNNEAAINFMIFKCTGDFMVDVITNGAAMGILRDSLYFNTVIGNPNWAKFITMLASD